MLFGRWAAGIAASLALTLLGWWAWHREDAIRPNVAVTVAPAPPQLTKPTTLPGAESAIAKSQRVALKPGVPQISESVPVRRADRSRHLIDRELYMADNAVDNSRKESRFIGRSGVTASEITTEEQVELVKKAGKTNAEATDQAADKSVLPEARVATTATADKPPVAKQSVVDQLLIAKKFTQQQQDSGNPPVSTDGQRDALAAVPAEEKLAATISCPEGYSNSKNAYTKLTIKPLVNHPVGNDRIVWYQSEQPITESAAPAAKVSRQRPWVSAGGSTVAFNSGLGLRPAFSSGANQYAGVSGNVISGIANPSPMIESQVGRAVSMQANVGMPLGEHWSLETGVGYLSSQNNVQSPVRLGTASFTSKSMASGNLYADLMARVTGSSLANADAMPANLAISQAYELRLANQVSSYDAAVHQAVSNSYQFVQVPVQVGYEFRPRRKLGLALLTGMVSNWFVRNTVADTYTVRPGNGIYRPVTLAGTAGMRLRFRPDKHWSASVAGGFQQSFQSLTKADVGMQATPQQMGLSFSVDRHF